jgi:hypothetical protein
MIERYWRFRGTGHLHLQSRRANLRVQMKGKQERDWSLQFLSARMYRVTFQETVSPR